MAVTAPSRPEKDEERASREGAQHNHLGTLNVGNGTGPQGTGVWSQSDLWPNLALGALLNAAQFQINNAPLLWVMIEDNGTYRFVFGFDLMVDNVAGTGQAKIGHVALAGQATISGEIKQEGAHWVLDNESGAWGSMNGLDGKSTKMATAARLISRFDPGGIVVIAEKAYSRHLVKRKIQQGVLSLFGR